LANQTIHAKHVTDNNIQNDIIIIQTSKPFYIVD